MEIILCVVIGIIIIISNVINYNKISYIKRYDRCGGIANCHHNWEISESSNVLQLDDMGYPLRLFICKCTKCGKSEQQWIDVGVDRLQELETGKSVLIKWSKY